MFETIGLITILIVGALAGGFCWAIEFWVAKRCADRTRVRIDFKRKKEAQE